MKLFTFLRLVFSAVFVFVASVNYAQTDGIQVVRGQVIDKTSDFPLMGALVEIDGIAKTMTDVDGYYKLDSIPLGRQTIIISFFGFQPVIKSNVLVTSGKQVEINVALEEVVFTMEEVVITGKKDKSKTNNENISVSGRTFSIEESKRFASSKNDPARMVQNFAGVSTSADDRNDIIVRGNSPLGVQYKLDGIVIPNPNHFGTLGTTGGPISILNNNNLANSDFLTGAFPAEYGNVQAGVFDLKLRTGNSEKREYVTQLGFNGLELGAEGPFTKKSRSSYVANYRYSTLGVFDALGISFGTAAIPQYQDGTFKLHFKTPKTGTISVFGMGGVSFIELLGSELDSDDLFAENDEDVRFDSKMAVVGVNQLLFFNDETSIRNFFSFSGSKTDILQHDLLFDSSFTEVDSRRLNYFNEFTQQSYTVGSEFKKKYSARLNTTFGVKADIHDFNFVDSVYSDDYNNYRILRSFDGITSMLSAFGHFQYKFDEYWILNGGIYSQLFTLNNTYVVEPRVGVQYHLKKQILSLGLGMHSQQQPFQVYLVESTNELTGESIGLTNKNLDFTKSAHVVLGYDLNLGNDWRIKAETYFQYIYNVPIELGEENTFSMLNAGADFGIPSVDSLINNGRGQNVGIELTGEKFYSKGYYFLSTFSLYNSNYIAGDKKWRNSAFNGNYTWNILGGKEFKIGKHNAIELDLKYTAAGGKRIVPIDLERSLLAGEAEFDDSRAYESRLDGYWRFDIRLGFRKEGKKITQEWAFDIQNVTNRQNIFSQEFDIKKGSIQTTYQLGMFPVAQYRVTF